MTGRRLIGLFVLLAPLAASAEALDNAAIIALSKAGLGSGPILAKVRQAPCGYDTSAPALIALKQAGVPEPVMTAMIERCAGTSAAPALPAVAATGIFLADGAGADARLTMLRPAAQSSTKLVGNGSILFPRIMRLIVPGPWARLVSSTSCALSSSENCAMRMVAGCQVWVV